MFYKVVVMGVVVEMTRRKSEAEAAFKDAAGRDKQVWQVGPGVARRVF